MGKIIFKFLRLKIAPADLELYSVYRAPQHSRNAVYQLAAAPRRIKNPLAVLLCRPPHRIHKQLIALLFWNCMPVVPAFLYPRRIILQRIVVNRPDIRHTNLVLRALLHIKTKYQKMGKCARCILLKARHTAIERFPIEFFGIINRKRLLGLFIKRRRSNRRKRQGCRKFPCAVERIKFRKKCRRFASRRVFPDTAQKPRKSQIRPQYPHIPQGIRQNFIYYFHLNFRK